MSDYFIPLEQLLHQLNTHPEYALWLLAGGGLLLALLGLVAYWYWTYFVLISKSLLRNRLRTCLAALATMVLVFVVTLICSVLLFLDQVMAERTRDQKAVVTERYQIPSLMPWSYADRLEEGAARAGHPEDVKPNDSMTWQFFGGTVDLAKRTRESDVFFFALDPHSIDPRRPLGPMMDDLEKLDPVLIDRMLANKKATLMGRKRLEALNKKVGERIVLSSFNYADVALEFEIVGELPPGRYDLNAFMNRDYLNDALEDYKRKHSGTPHPMAAKTLNLVWLRVADSTSFQRVADQIMTSSEFTIPSVKCETASSGIATFLDAYRDLIWGVKWLLVPAILVTMTLVIANAISISVRERRTEMAVLKVLGFGPGRIMALVLGEAILVGAGSGLFSAVLTYGIIHIILHGIWFPMGFFPIFDIYADAIWWGLLFGGFTAFAGSIVPAWSARTVKVSDVFSKVG
jgi:putative ABC transport system permease protein